MALCRTLGEVDLDEVTADGLHHLVAPGGEPDHDACTSHEQHPYRDAAAPFILNVTTALRARHHERASRAVWKEVLQTDRHGRGVPTDSD